MRRVVFITPFSVCCNKIRIITNERIPMVVKCKVHSWKYSSISKMHNPLKRISADLALQSKEIKFFVK